MKIIRREIETCGLSRYRIAQDNGLSEAQLHRVVVQNGSLKAETVGQLLEYFGYELKKKKKGR